MIFRESESVELKATVVEDIRKEIIAFANCNGGKLYIGIGDNGDIIGLDNPDSSALQISNMVRDAIKPDLTMFLHYETLNFDGKYVIAIDVQRGTERPYYIGKKGLRPEGVYVRQGFSSVPATETAIRKMIKETDGDHFEDMRSLIQELSFDAAHREFSDRNIPLGPIQMKTLGLTNQDDLYTNLGQLLSDQCVHTIKVAVFEGSTQNIFKDRKEFSGSLFKQMTDVYTYIDFHNQTHAEFDKLRRIDTRDYPEAAVREALLNCLVHREYSFSSSTLISIFSDRMEYTSIGGLVSGISLNDIMLGISVCRNVKLANIFYRLELIEAYGTGIRKIMDAYKDSEIKPQIITSDNAFKIILPNLNVRREDVPAMQTALSTVDQLEAHILKNAKENGFITRKNVEDLFCIGQSTSGRILKKMVHSGQLIQVGKGKGTRYCLPE